MSNQIGKWFGVFIFCCLMACQTQAQQAPIFNKNVILSQKNYDFNELLHALQSQAKVTFSYDYARVRPEILFHFNRKKATLGHFLNQITQQAVVHYKKVAQHYIIFTSQKHIDTTTRQIAPEVIYFFGDSNKVANYYFGHSDFYLSKSPKFLLVRRFPKEPGQDVVVNNPTEAPWLNREPKTWHRSWLYYSGFVKYVKNNFWLRLGGFADETFYIAPTVQLGYRFLYLKASYGVGAIRQLRYGLGAELALTDKRFNNWHLRFEISTNLLPSSTLHFPWVDSITQINPDDSSISIIGVQKELDIKINSRLSRLSISAAYDLSPKLSFAGGLVFNYLQTSYSAGGDPLDLSGENNIPISEGADDFGLIHPPYTVNDNYNASTATRTTMWIGLQVSVYYKFGKWK